MLTVNKILSGGRGLAAALVRRAPQVELDWDVRQKSRFDCTDSAGRRLGVFLPRGSVVRGGDVLVAEDGSLLRVVAAPQPVLTVRTAAGGDGFDLLRAAYHLGNRHVPLELQPEHLRLEPDHVLAELLRTMGLSVTEAQAPFEPESGAYAAGGAAVGGHRHDHDHGHGRHGHDHDHDHDHGHGHGESKHAHAHGPDAACGQDHGHSHGHEHSHAPPGNGERACGPSREHAHGRGHEHEHEHEHGPGREHDHGHRAAADREPDAPAAAHRAAPAAAASTAATASPVAATSGPPAPRGRPIGVPVAPAAAPHVHGPGCKHGPHEH